MYVGIAVREIITPRSSICFHCGHEKFKVDGNSVDLCTPKVIFVETVLRVEKHFFIEFFILFFLQSRSQSNNDNKTSI